MSDETYKETVKKALANGTMKNPIPEDLVNVYHSVPMEKRADILDSLDIGKNAWYDFNFEVWVSPDTLKEALQS